MGLNTSHSCWDGSYSSFYRWRMYIAKLANIPLPFMEGFCDLKTRNISDKTLDEQLSRITGTPGTQDFSSFLPIKWEALHPSPLHLLINHSDCDGSIPHLEALGIAVELEILLPEIEKDNQDIYAHQTRRWINGLRQAHSLMEDVIFR